MEKQIEDFASIKWEKQIEDFSPINRKSQLNISRTSISHAGYNGN